ncbi:MAG: hypothetical protein J6U05_00655 [Neisseriaceae bacterium]|nr:hypothetical protein [Neisseriaceae bacterium]
MPRRAFGTARNDDRGFRLPEITDKRYLKNSPAARQDIIIAHCFTQP